MTDFTKVTVEERDGQVFVYRPKCPICNENMEKGIYKYYDTGKTKLPTTFTAEHLYTKLLYVCRKHLDQRQELDIDQLGILNSYRPEYQQFVSY